MSSRSQKTTKVSTEPMQAPAGVYSVPFEAGQAISAGVAVTQTLVVVEGAESVVVVPVGGSVRVYAGGLSSEVYAGGFSEVYAGGFSSDVDSPCDVDERLELATKLDWVVEGIELIDELWLLLITGVEDTTAGEDDEEIGGGRLVLETPKVLEAAFVGEVKVYGLVVPLVVTQPQVGKMVVDSQVCRTVTVMTGTSSKSARDE